MEALINSKKPLQVLGSSLAWLESDLGGALAKWGPHLFIGTNGLSRTLEGSLQIKNILEILTLIYVQLYVQEYTKDL